MNTHCKSMQMALLVALLLASVGSLVVGTAVEAKAQSVIAIDQLAGPWRIGLVGNTIACGATSMLFTGTLNTSGTATGTLSDSSGCGPFQAFWKFAISSLNADGSRTASLSCGSGCGWTFDIQVAPNEQMFNLVDVVNGGANVLAGTAVAHLVSPITVDQLAGPWHIALVGNTGCGQTAMQFTGTLNASGTATGTLSASSTGCPSSSSTQTFTINKLYPEGFAWASLSCGLGCGWKLSIQVAANQQMFSLVDVANGASNALAGIAIANPVVKVPDLISDSLAEARAAVQAVGLQLISLGFGNVAIQAPAAGTFVPVGSTVTVLLIF